MFSDRPSFEAFKQNALLVEPTEAIEIQHALRAGLEQKLSHTALCAASVEEVHRNDSVGMWHKYRSYNHIEARFSDVVLPIERDDVLSFYSTIGTGEHAEAKWTELVHPTRETADDDTEFINQFRATPFHDIYPVFLTCFERTERDQNDKILPNIDEQTAVVDLASLKTYLAWLNDRETVYEELLPQHFSPQSRVLWEAFVAYYESKSGITAPVNAELFGYFDMSSDFLVHRERGRRTVLDEVDRARQGKRRRLTHAEVYRLNLIPPEEDLMITRDLLYAPSGQPADDVLPDYVSLGDFIDAAAMINIKEYAAKLAFSKAVGRIAGNDRDAILGAELYLIRIFNLSYEKDYNWSKQRLWIRRDAIVDLLARTPKKGPGKFGPKERQVVAALTGHIRARDRPSNDEINEDDPDLMSPAAPMKPPEEW